MQVFDRGTLDREALKAILTCPEGAVEKFDDVNDFLARGVNRGAGAQLEQATGIGRRDNLRFGGSGAGHFFGEKIE